MKRKLLAVIGILAMLLGLSPGFAFAAAPVTAQVVEPASSLAPTMNGVVVHDSAGIQSVRSVYLPILGAPRPPGPTPVSSYAGALSQALADCAGTTLNQVCYAHGSVTLDGGASLTTPGQVANLDGVSGLTLVSPDASHWSVALMRLATDSSTPDLGLTLLAFGNVEISNLVLFDAAAGNSDAAPALSFKSSAVPGQDPETGGLIVYNPNSEDPLPINLNGADLTLASSAVVQAQPGAKMTVTMATGSALVSTAAGDSAVLQGHQVTVLLDAKGDATGAPTPPTVTDDELLAPLTCEGDDCLLVPLVPPRRQIYDAALADFWTARDSCLRGNSRQVYRVMYYARIIKQFEAEFPSDVPGWLDRQVKDCATFEFEFNSVITGTSSYASGNMYVQEQGIIVSFGMDGSLDQLAEMPLRHVRYDMQFAWGSCAYVVLEDGRLLLEEGYMRINRNRLDISTTVAPPGVWEHLIVTCGDMGEIANAAAWFPLFTDLHRSERVLTGFLFTPAHWKYTGNQILAEAIFTREARFVDGVATGDTWLVMLHRPGR